MWRGCYMVGVGLGVDKSKRVGVFRERGTCCARRLDRVIGLFGIALGSLDGG